MCTSSRNASTEGQTEGEGRNAQEEWRQRPFQETEERRDWPEQAKGTRMAKHVPMCGAYHMI